MATRKPPRRHAQLMQVFFAAGERLRQAAEDPLDALLQQRGDAIGCAGCHGKVTGKSREPSTRRVGPKMSGLRAFPRI